MSEIVSLLSVTENDSVVHKSLRDDNLSIFLRLLNLPL